MHEEFYVTVVSMAPRAHSHFLENNHIHAAYIAAVSRYWEYRSVGAFVVLASQATILTKVF